MIDLASFLVGCWRAHVKGPLVVINTDNVPNNGTMIEAIIRNHATLAKTDLNPEEYEGG